MITYNEFEMESNLAFEGEKGTEVYPTVKNMKIYKPNE